MRRRTTTFSDLQTAKTFERFEYRFLIVAEKFQAEFDQPFLHTMYVDRKLAGVHAIQTLSRLNRLHPGKEETMVLDFGNEAEAIKEAFEPYYDRIVLSEGTDPNLLYDLQNRLANFQFYTQSEVNQFAKICFDPKATQAKLHAALVPVVDRFKAATKEDRLNHYSSLLPAWSVPHWFSLPFLKVIYMFKQDLSHAC